MRMRMPPTLLLHARMQVPYREMLDRIHAAYPGVRLARADDLASEVAKNFTVPGHRGSVSFITSMTSHFCGDCNRCDGCGA